MPGFTKREESKRYIPQNGDTLETIAQRETEAGNPITADELACYNWGTDDPEVVNEHLRDELGCYRRDGGNNFMISEDVSGEGELRIPQRYSREGLALDKTHEVRVRRKAPPPPQLKACVTIPGVTFGYDMSFIRSSVVEYLKELEKKVAANPTAKVIIFGHTDKVGGESYNKALSERRAESVYAFITNDVETWERLYQKEDWGESVLSEILAEMGSYYDPEEAGSFEEAVQRFQESRFLSGDGNVDVKTRKQLFREYMMGKHDVKLTSGQFLDPKFMGCGEFNPVIAAAGSAEMNRRVVFYLIHDQRTPNLPCALGDLAPCRRQMVDDDPRENPTFRCSFYDSIASTCESGGVTAAPAVAHLTIEVEYEAEMQEGAIVTITGPSGPQEKTTDAMGRAAFRDLRPGDYEVRARMPGDHPLVNRARQYVGSKTWAEQRAYGPYPAGSNKCNIFVFAVANAVSYWVPKKVRIDWLPDDDEFRLPEGKPYEPLAGQWADPDVEIGDWKMVSSPQPGDVIAEAGEYSNASGHVGIVSFPAGGGKGTLKAGDDRTVRIPLKGQTVSQGTLRDDTGAITQDEVLENDWGFRPNSHPSYRRYSP